MPNYISLHLNKHDASGNDVIVPRKIGLSYCFSGSWMQNNMSLIVSVNKYKDG